MKHKINIQHQRVPALLFSFSITFFTGAFISDLALNFSNNSLFDELAEYLDAAGIFFALSAALPLMIIYLSKIPLTSLTLTRVTRYSILTISMLLFFIMAVVFRYNNEIGLTLILVLEGLGIFLLFAIRRLYLRLY